MRANAEPYKMERILFTRGAPKCDNIIVWNFELVK